MAGTDNDLKTPGNQPVTDDMLSRMVRQIDEMHAAFTAMRPLLEAFQRGGIIGARTAARRMARDG